MSRFRKFAHSLISGYVSLAASIAYTLASVPLALRYLSKAEFGLWGVTLLVASYHQLRRQLGTAGRAACETKYDWQRVLDAYEALFARLGRIEAADLAPRH